MRHIDQTHLRLPFLASRRVEPPARSLGLMAFSKASCHLVYF